MFEGIGSECQLSWIVSLPVDAILVLILSLSPEGNIVFKKTSRIG